MLRISHKKVECIGCDHCTNLAPQYWYLDEDGLAQLIDPTLEKNGFQYGEGFDDDWDILDAAAEGCPVQIIKIDG